MSNWHASCMGARVRLWSLIWARGICSPPTIHRLRLAAWPDLDLPLALLQSGKLSPTESLVCRRTLRVGMHDLCSHPQTGPLQAALALAYSCNDFFATFGLRLSFAELQAAFDKAGGIEPQSQFSCCRVIARCRGD